MQWQSLTLNWPFKIEIETKMHIKAQMSTFLADGTEHDNRAKTFEKYPPS
jgi:hypothetical protein